MYFKRDVSLTNLTKQSYWVTIVYFLLFSMLPLQVYADEESANIFNIPLANLLQMDVSKAYTLTETTRRDIPSAFTTITRDMIESSGARNLDELLEIYVPGLHTWRHTSNGGLYFVTRGILSNQSVLMLVNGRVMNERMLSGAHSERAISMLGDIASIEFIRGPGAAVHGAGALAGVINIKTFSGNTFKGKDVTIRRGGFEQFTTAEFRLGKELSPDSNLFVYYGIDSYKGGSVKDSPFVFVGDHGEFTAGEESTAIVPPLNQSFRDKPRHKLHVQLNKGELEAWARFVKGGLNLAAPEHTQGTSYDQLTLNLSHQKKLSDTLKLSSKLSYDTYNWVQDRNSQRIIDLFTTRAIESGQLSILKNPSATAFLEEQILAGLALDWKPKDDLKFHIGFDYSRDNHMQDGYGWPHFDVSNFIPPYHTSIYSLITEGQWNINNKFTFFGGLRYDKHSLMEDPNDIT